jgi:hypothetical protein
MERICTRWLCAAIWFLVLALLAGGCITAKYFLLPGKEAEYEVFEGHKLYSGIANSIYGNDGSQFRISLGQEFYPKIVDSASLSSYPYVEIDSLFFVLDCDTTRYCPIADTSYKRGIVRRIICDEHGGIIGPSFSWGWKPIPDKCKQMRVWFVARLIDPLTGEVQDTKPVEMTLTRKHDRVGSWLK